MKCKGVWSLREHVQTVCGRRLLTTEWPRWRLRPSRCFDYHYRHWWACIGWTIERDLDLGLLRPHQLHHKINPPQHLVQCPPTTTPFLDPHPHNLNQHNYHEARDWTPSLYHDAHEQLVETWNTSCLTLPKLYQRRHWDIFHLYCHKGSSWSSILMSPS